MDILYQLTRQILVHLNSLRLMASFPMSKRYAIGSGTPATSDKSDYIANYHRGRGVTNNYKCSDVNNFLNNGLVQGHFFNGGIADRIGEYPGVEYDYSSSDEDSEAERYDAAKLPGSNKAKKSGANYFKRGNTNNYQGCNVNNFENNGVVKGQMFCAGIYGADRVGERENRSKPFKPRTRRKDNSHNKSHVPPQAKQYAGGYNYYDRSPSVASSNNGPADPYTRAPVNRAIYSPPVPLQGHASQPTGYGAPPSSNHAAIYDPPPPYVKSPPTQAVPALYNDHSSTYTDPTSYPPPPATAHYAPASFVYRP